MLLYKRAIESKIKSAMFKGRMVALLGPRQSGKTTLSKRLIEEYANKGAYFDCQLAEVRKHFELGMPEKLLPLVKGKKVVIFDEAQTIQDIGSILKAFHDTYPKTQIIATGSSSFDLANRIKESMTGRIFEFTLLPLSLDEIKNVREIKIFDLYQLMLYGTYPAVVAAKTTDDKKLVLKNIATQYLYKDVFVFEAIRNPQIFENLLKLLALQIGSLVSLNELSMTLGVSRALVQRYLRLLEQSFIIKIIRSFSNNPRNEIKKSFKIIFLDIGVRNALVDVEKDMEERADRGNIFENFFISERIKIANNEHIFPPEIMFWRSRKGEEIDVIEKNGMEIAGYECKWKNKKVLFDTFSKYYPEVNVQVVNPSDML